MSLVRSGSDEKNGVDMSWADVTKKFGLKCPYFKLKHLSRDVFGRKCPWAEVSDIHLERQSPKVDSLTLKMLLKQYIWDSNAFRPINNRKLLVIHCQFLLSSTGCAYYR